MRIPAVTGWGYSKDFPRFAGHTFHAQWNKIKQEVSEKVVTGSLIPDSLVAESPMPASPGSLADQFTSELIALGGTVVRVAEKDLPDRLAGFLKERGIPSVYTDEVGARYGAALQTAGTAVVRAPDPQIRCGITGALAGLADTGTLVMVGSPARPLTASLLPEIHVALLRVSELVPSLPDALRRPEVRASAAAVLITGPSRTADIEMTLTIGVHGPKEVIVFLIDDSEAV
jgi:L-lactate dehydrogenase complex protein LldG